LPEECARDILFRATTLLQAGIVAGVLFFITFYYFPHRLVLGTYASIFFFLAGIGAQLFPYSGRLWNFTAWYFRLLTTYFVESFAVSVFVACLLALWGAVMFGEIRRRYEYLNAIGEAIQLVNADQIAVPRAELMANAFQRMPNRPEVPFILARSVRVLSPGNDLLPFQEYMKTFTSFLDPKTVLSNSTQIPDRSRLSAEPGPGLPVLEPVELIAQFKVEVPDKDQEKQYVEAVSMLDTALAAKADLGLKIYRQTLQAELDLEIRKPSDSERVTLIDTAIRGLEESISDASKSAAASGSRLFVDQTYQEALDAIGDLNLQRAFLPRARPSAADGSIPQPGQQAGCEIYAAKAIDAFSRLLILRRRLMVNGDILWWRPPNKLTLYHIFTHLSGQHSSVAETIEKQSREVCPQAWEKLKDLYAAPAFKTFQDPDQWAAGTPIASAFNGSAAAAQLRKWLQLGW
jgi:hypothetical protein